MTVLRWLRHIQQRLRLNAAERAVASFQRGGDLTHSLPGELIVSLTSYPARFCTLAMTLKGLLAQTIRANRTILWIASQHITLLPADVKELQDIGLEIRSCDDLRSYKKIIPALLAFPEAYVVTADDDLYYDPNWLSTLVEGVVPCETVRVCRRAHRPKLIGHSFAPYAEWDWDFVTDEEVRDDLFPTGCGGVLYPPGSLASEVCNKDAIRRLCPTADDIWLFWMGRLAGSQVKQVGGGFAQIVWEGSQVQSLMSENLAGRNDEQLRAVIAEYPHRPSM